MGAFVGITCLPSDSVRAAMMAFGAGSLLCAVTIELYVTLRYITLRYVTLRYVTLRYVTLRYVTLRYVTLRYVVFVWFTRTHGFPSCLIPLLTVDPNP
jgi:hypothetical protein